jgi:hypothetical protein
MRKEINKNGTDNTNAEYIVITSKKNVRRNITKFATCSKKSGFIINQEKTKFMRVSKEAHR